MALGATSIDGLISGLDTTNLINSLADIRRKPISLLTKRQTQRAGELQAYQTLTARLQALQANAAVLSSGEAFKARSISASQPGRLLASASAGASVGSYAVSVEQLAGAHKIAAATVADPTAALGYEGDIRLNGKTISLTAGDSLNTLREAINSAAAGVSASLLRISATENRLVLTALKSGADHAIHLGEANAAGIWQGLGLAGGAPVTRHALERGLASDSLTSNTAAVGEQLKLSGPVAGTVKVNGVEVAVDLATDSLQDLASRISSTVGGVTASVAAAPGGGFRLEIVGDEGAPVLEDDGGVWQALGVQSTAPANELAAARNAQLKVDGYLIERNTNSIDDAIAGVSLDLLQAAPGDTFTLQVSPNSTAGVNALQQLVSAFNSVVDTLNAGLQWNSEASEGGAFFGDMAILNIQQGLHDAAINPVGLLGGGGLNLPSQLGLSLGETGRLVLNESVLREVMASDPEGLQGLLTTRGQAASDEVLFDSATDFTNASGSAGYAINITRAATRATTRSSELSAGITQDETLTINGKYSLTLRAGETLEQASDRLNTVFAGADIGLQASVEGDRLQIQSRFYGSAYKIDLQSSLSAGEGGTDLGGALAGEVQRTTGQDVAGTINGQAATGWGQWLTADAGAAKGLKLKVTATTTGDKGVVHVNQGLASRLAGYLTRITDPGEGLMSRATTGVSDDITAIEAEKKRLEASVAAYVERLQLKFAAAEGIMARNKATQDYLTAQVQTITKQFSSK